MKIYMTMHVEGFKGGHADARIEIPDDLLAPHNRTRAKRLPEFIAGELHAYVEGMVRKNIENGAIKAAASLPT